MDGLMMRSKKKNLKNFFEISPKIAQKQPIEYAARAADKLVKKNFTEFSKIFHSELSLSSRRELWRFISKIRTRSI